MSPRRMIDQKDVFPNVFQCIEKRDPVLLTGLAIVMDNGTHAKE